MYSPVITESRSNSPAPFQPSDQQQLYYNHGQYSAVDNSTASGYKSVTADRDFDTPPTRDSLPSSSTPHPIVKNQHQRTFPLQQYQYPQYTDDTKDQNAHFTSSLRPSSTSSFISAMRPPHGTALTTSTIGSFDARARSIASHQSSDHNLAHGNDAQYNLTQNDLTLEGLSERWQAYQAWWAKQYKEQPFYRLWTRSKWLLLLSVLMLLTYSCAAFAVALGYMLGRFEYSAVVMEFHGNIVYIATAASACGILSALVGLIGIFKEDRMWLSWYNVMLWPVFTLYISIGYIAFRRIKNQLRAHLKDEWTHSYTREQRLLVQRHLKCCGYRSSSSHGEYDLRCFPMINLPGCEHKYNLYEHRILTTCWTASFSLAPFLLFAMVVALLCSNHVDGMLRSGRPGLKSFKSSKEQ